jgi:hypothetical protein
MNTENQTEEKRSIGYNSTYPKLEVQWVNEVLLIESSLVMADSLSLRNLVATKR